MKSKRTRRFGSLFEALPESVQQEANEAYRRFKADPTHPSLHFRPLQAHPSVYTARVGLHYRALAIRQPDCWLWFWIGSHADYDRLLASR